MTDLKSDLETKTEVVLLPEEKEKAEYWLNMQSEFAKTNPWFPWMGDRRQRSIYPRQPRSLYQMLCPWADA